MSLTSPLIDQAITLRTLEAKLRHARFPQPKLRLPSWGWPSLCRVPYTRSLKIENLGFEFVCNVPLGDSAC